MTLDLELLAKLHEEATPGPWEACHDGHSPENGKLGNWVHTTNWDSLPDPDDSSDEVCDCPNSSLRPAENAKLIAAMRNALPELLSLARSASELQERLDKQISSNLGFVEQNAKLIERNKTLGDLPLLDGRPDVVALAREASEAKARLERIESALEFLDNHYVGSLEVREIDMRADALLEMAAELGWKGRAT